MYMCIELSSEINFTIPFVFDRYTLEGFFRFQFLIPTEEELKPSPPVNNPSSTPSTPHKPKRKCSKKKHRPPQ